MDTGDLSENTYKVIILESERFNHDLTIQFGLLSYECTNESDFITKAEKLIWQMLKYEDGEIDDMFFGNPPRKVHFHKALNKILSNIGELQKK